MTDREKADDPDVLIDPSYHEELELQKQRVQIREYVASKWIILISLGISMSSDNDEEVTVITIVWQGQSN